MKFSAHERVLELLVGQNLYASADAAIRELLQNAEDACTLQNAKAPSAYSPSINVRYSALGNWFEIADNGIGMDEESFEHSFTSIGAPKGNVPKLAALIQQAGSQIAQFGIGVLSCFGVAETLEVYSKTDEDPGIAVRITGIRDEFQRRADAPTTRGTRIRLQLKQGGPMTASAVPAAAAKYSPMAPHITVQDVDTGNSWQLAQKHTLDAADDKFALNDMALLSGHLKLDQAWTTLTERFQSRLLICNGGFLVSEKEGTLIKPQAIGYVGELDVRPGALSILMNREGFKKDAAWTALGQRLWEHYLARIDNQLTAWSEDPDVANAANRPAIERALLLLAKGPTSPALPEATRNKVRTILPQIYQVKIAESDDASFLSSILNGASERGLIYFVEEGQGEQQVQKSFAEGGGHLQFTETIQTKGLRTRLLKANGFIVLSLRRSQFTVDQGNGSSTITIRDLDVVTEYCSQSNIKIIPVEQAPEEHTHLGPRPEGKVLSELFEVGEEIKFASLPSSAERVVRDYNGRLLNFAHPEIRQILQLLPETMGNPIRRKLLQAYMDVTTYNFGRARSTLAAILTDPQFEQLCQLKTGALLEEYLRGKVEKMLGEPQ